MEVKKISEFEWEVGLGGKVFASEELMEKISGDGSLDQVENVSRLPGILGKSLAMPDIHRGYGFSIGGVAAFDLESGVICPGGVGYDINCSVRLLKTNLKAGDLKGKEKKLVSSLAGCIPSGVGKGGGLKLSYEELDDVLSRGAAWAVEKGYGVESDLEHIEDFGCLKGALPSEVSFKAKSRGKRQLGTLGGGNHFLDVLIVDEVFDSKVAKIFGLEEGQVVIMIHCGSRGLGHQVASDYIAEMSNVENSGLENFASFSKVGLACAPFRSEIGQRYFGAMAAAANFAFANKQIIDYFVREEFKKFFSDFKAEVVYDICHNIAKVEKHFFEGRKRDVLVIRKGATRAFGAGREEVCEDYREVGQPVLLPGSMGTMSYVLVGTGNAMEKSWGSLAHGAGRALSRNEARETLSFEEACLAMENVGVFVKARGRKGMVEEAPGSYKDVDEVVRVCDSAGLGRKVLKMRPVLVVIG